MKPNAPRATGLFPAGRPAGDVRRTSAGTCMLVANGLEAHRVETFETKEPETVAWIRDFVRDGESLVDVGANVGVYALYAAMVHRSSTVYAFEPYLPNFHRLCENVRLNGLDNVVPLPIALSDGCAIESFFAPDDRIGGSGGQIGRPVDERGAVFEPADRHPVLTHTLDACVSLFGLPVPHHVKIDVDGAEARVLDGMRETLSHPTLRSLLVEINTETTPEEAVRDRLAALGFSAENPFQKHPRHSRRRREGSRSASAVNLIVVRGGSAW
jgi:FkbM family methyltransferase